MIAFSGSGVAQRLKGSVLWDLPERTLRSGAKVNPTAQNRVPLTSHIQQ